MKLRLAIGICVAVCGTVYAESGVVIDQTTGKPLPGTIAVAWWRAQILNPIHSSSECYHLSVSVADAQGRYTLDDWSGTVNPLRVNRKREVSFYKPGYSSEPVNRSPSTVSLRPFVGSANDRFNADLHLWGRECPEADRKLVPLAEAMYSEAKGLAATEEQEAIALNMIYLYERGTIEEKQAYENHVARVKASRLKWQGMK